MSWKCPGLLQPTDKRASFIPFLTELDYRFVVKDCRFSAWSRVDWQGELENINSSLWHKSAFRSVNGEIRGCLCWHHSLAKLIKTNRTFNLLVQYIYVCIHEYIDSMMPVYKICLITLVISCTVTFWSTSTSNAETIFFLFTHKGMRMWPT